MLEGVLDVSWTCDQSAVLGAGNDKSIRVWDPLTGRARHTMTGHTGKVASPFLISAYLACLEIAKMCARKVHGLCTSAQCCHPTRSSLTSTSPEFSRYTY